MKEEIIRLHKLRIQQQELIAIKKRAVEKFELDNKQLIDSLDELQLGISLISDGIKTVALEEYAKTGNKKLDFGVGIQVRKVLDYDDKDALKWAKEHGLALSLNKTAFKKFATADPMDFVEIKENVIATLPAEFKIEVSEK